MLAKVSRMLNQTTFFEEPDFRSKIAHMNRKQPDNFQQNSQLKILMVCLGNICRSPIAHGLLQHKAELLGLNWEIDSAGTSNWHEGELPNENSIRVMKQHGVDITYQRSRPLTLQDIEQFDIIYVMDAGNYRDVTNMANSEQQISKVRYIMNELHPGNNQPVPDPWGLGEENYEYVYEMLHKATDKIIERYTLPTVQ